MAAPGASLAAATDRALSDPTVKNLIFGEVIHADNSFYRQFVSTENMDSLKKNGVTEIAIELPESFQYSVNAFTRGEWTEERFKNNIKSQFQFFGMDEAQASERRDLIANMVKQAHERGIKVQCIDHMRGTDEMGGLMTPEAQRKIKDCTTNKIGAMTDAEMEAIAEDIQKVIKIGMECIYADPELRKFAEGVDRERLSGDTKLGADAAARNPNGRTVFFIGSGHGAGIAAGYPGKSEGIAGVFDENTNGVRKTTPFFRFHYNIESGEISLPSFLQRLFSVAPAPAAVPA